MIKKMWDFARSVGNQVLAGGTRGETCRKLVVWELRVEGNAKRQLEVEVGAASRKVSP
jgi:hypothetical protein